MLQITFISGIPNVDFKIALYQFVLGKWQRDRDKYLEQEALMRVVIRNS
jgi:hypothetical protein